MALYTVLSLRRNDPEPAEPKSMTFRLLVVFAVALTARLLYAADALRDLPCYELRIYHAAEGKLDALNARFRDHTMQLFGKHGMTNVGYFVYDAGQKNADADNTLIYLLAHKSKDAAEASFKAFRADPDWVAAKAASEKDGGGSLTTPDGVKSVFLAPTDYSPTK